MQSKLLLGVVRTTAIVAAFVLVGVVVTASTGAQSEQDAIWAPVGYAQELTSPFLRFKLGDADFKEGRAALWRLRDPEKLFATLNGIPAGQRLDVLLPTQSGLQSFAVGPNPQCGGGLTTETWRTPGSVGAQPRTAILRRVGGGLRIYGADASGILFDTMVAGNLHLAVVAEREPAQDGSPLYCATNAPLFDRSRVRLFGLFGGTQPPVPGPVALSPGIEAQGYTRVNVLALTTPAFVALATTSSIARQQADFLIEKAGEVFRRDASIVLCPVSIDAAADTVTDAEANAIRTAGSDFGQVATSIVDRYGTDYDVGHVLFTGTSTGRAAPGGIGNGTLRGGGTSYLANLNDFAVLAHEIGHQLGAGHTFSGAAMAGYFDAASAVEPGSGSTLMSYGGRWPVASQDLGQELYLHARSVEQIRAGVHRAIAPAVGASLTIVASGGATSYTVPPRTPIELRSVVTSATTAPPRARWDAMDAAINPGDRPPIYRSWEAYKMAREFPARPFRANTLLGGLGDGWLVAGQAYRFTAVGWGDNGAIGSTQVTLEASGTRFIVITPAANAWQAQTTVTVQWTPTTLASQVRVRLSIDSGNTWAPAGSFNAAVGSAWITAPASGPFAMIRVEAVDNVFFAESGVFTIRP